MLRSLALFILTATLALAADVTGTWKFAVTLASGGTGEPTFVLKQSGKNVTGTYSGPLGQYDVTGTQEGDSLTISFSFTREDQTVRATYSGKVESSEKMSGSMKFSGAGEGTQEGQWTAKKMSK